MPEFIAISLVTIHCVCLFLLCIYGFHRFWLVKTHLRTRNTNKSYPKKFEKLPKVTIQLPIYNEKEVLARLLEHTTAIDYPSELLEIQLLDDSTDQTAVIANDLVTHYRRCGINIKRITRCSREGFKAGALANGLKQAEGDFVAIFDADFLPKRDFLKSSINFFSDPNIGMVQCRWTHTNNNYSLLTRAQAILLDGHFRIEHPARNRSHCFFNFNGTAGIWRKAAIVDAGGWSGDTITEDLDLSYRAQLKGWKFEYLTAVEVPAELPVALSGFRSQQHRWTKGAIEVLKKLLNQILRSNISSRQKREALFHLSSNCCYPLLLAAGILTLPALEAQRQLSSSRLEMLTASADVLFLTSFFSVVMFYGVASREQNQPTPTIVLEIFSAIAIGIALSLSNTIAVFEAFTGRKSPFNVTPKTGILNGLPVAKGYISNSNWRPWLPHLELTLALYFLVTLLYSLRLGYFQSIPFALLFTYGFAYFGITSLILSRRATTNTQLKPIQGTAND